MANVVTSSGTDRVNAADKWCPLSVLVLARASAACKRIFLIFSDYCRLSSYFPLSRRRRGNLAIHGNPRPDTSAARNRQRIAGSATELRRLGSPLKGCPRPAPSNKSPSCFSVLRAGWKAGRALTLRKVRASAADGFIRERERERECVMGGGGGGEKRARGCAALQSRAADKPLNSRRTLVLAAPCGALAPFGKANP